MQRFCKTAYIKMKALLHSLCYNVFLISITPRRFILTFHLALIIAVLFLPLPSQAAQNQDYEQVCLKIVNAIEGPLGALLTACAGVGAICAAAMGGFKMAWTLLVTSVGSFILQSYIHFWFNVCNEGL